MADAKNVEVVEEKVVEKTTANKPVKKAGAKKNDNTAD